MTTVFLMLSFPIGILFLFLEQHTKMENKAVFDEYVLEVMNNKSYKLKDRVVHIRNMFEINHFLIHSIDNGVVIASKKEFSIGMMFIGIGSMFIGLIIYLLYYFYFKKPSVVTIDVRQNGEDEQI